MMIILRRDTAFPTPTAGPTFGIWDLYYDGNDAAWDDSEVQWQRLTALVLTGEME